MKKLLALDISKILGIATLCCFAIDQFLITDHDYLSVIGGIIGFMAIYFGLPTNQRKDFLIGMLILALVVACVAIGLLIFKPALG